MQDAGSIPDPGRSRKPQSSEARKPQLLGLCSRAWELQLLSPGVLEPVLCNKSSRGNDKPAHPRQRKILAAGRPRRAVQTASPGPVLQVLGQHLTFFRPQLPHFTTDGAPGEQRPPSGAPCGQSSCLWRDRQQGAGSHSPERLGARDAVGHSLQVFTRDVREASGPGPRGRAAEGQHVGAQSGDPLHAEFGFN